MVKVYGIHNRTQAIIKIPANGGRAWLEVEFRHGRIGAGMGNRPATYSTADPTEQFIIENSPMYGRVYKLIRTAGTDDDAKPAAAKAPSAPKLKAELGITSREDAVAFLKQNGAKATNLKDDESIQKYAAKIGVCFPNLYE